MKLAALKKSIFLSFCAMSLVPGVALADQFSMMDRVENGSGIEVTAGTVIIDGANGTILKNDYHLQLGLEQLGVYLFVPTTHIIGDSNNSAMGNLELGAVGHTDLNSIDLAYRFSVSLPTAGGTVEDALTNAFGAILDPANLTAGMRDVLAIRTSVSPTMDLGPLFVRGDVGTDVLIGTGDSADDAEVILRLNGAVGLDVGGLSLAGEFTNSFLLTESGSDPLSSLGLTAAVDVDSTSLFVGVAIPVSNGLAGLDSQAFVVNTGLRLNF